MMQKAPELRNLLIAFVLSTIVIMAWQVFFVYPQKREYDAWQAQQTALKAQMEAAAPAKADVVAQTITPKVAQAPVTPPKPAGTVTITSGKLHGTINLQGARFDQLKLAQYRETLDPASPEVVLLQPSANALPYFAEFGWLSDTPGVSVPDANTVWKSDGKALTPTQPVTLTWENGQGLRFSITVALDENYLFSITRKVENTGKASVGLFSYGLLNRGWQPKEHFAILHEGPLGTVDGALVETTYDDLHEKPLETYANASGWLGITDKYWLTAIIPDGATNYTMNNRHIPKEGGSRYQTDYLGPRTELAEGQTAETTVRFFAGPKELKLLDGYAEQYSVPLFDRAVDLGVLYFLTKPIFVALNYFYGLLGNFGLAILLLTVCIKLVLFPLANKSFISINQMRALQPEIVKLKERFGDDRMRMNQEIMELYKRERVNPMAGCLPILIQLPIFFALYKVLFVTIEMRHAPFYGWIHDLSIPDPTNIFTLFGLIPWDPPSLLHVGIWPLIMFVTTVIQQKLQPKPTDPIQERVMTLMPYMFVFLFASFPAGLIIYWSWSNALSILQQVMIARIHKPVLHKPGSKTPAKKKSVKK